MAALWPSIKPLPCKKYLPRRANHWNNFIIQELESPRRETGRGLFESDGDCCRITFVPPQFRSPMRLGATQGNRDEQTACCGTDRRIVYFVRGKSAGSCRGCCPGRGVGSSCFGSRGRSCRRLHWIYGRALDRAFLGASAIRIAIPDAARNTSHAWNPGTWDPATSRRQGDFVTCQKSRNGYRKASAAGSGI
jgi:hypothetical protein